MKKISVAMKEIREGDFTTYMFSKKLMGLISVLCVNTFFSGWTLVSIVGRLIHLKDLKKEFCDFATKAKEIHDFLKESFNDSIEDRSMNKGCTGEVGTKAHNKNKFYIAILREVYIKLMGIYRPLNEKLLWKYIFMFEGYLHMNGRIQVTVFIGAVDIVFVILLAAFVNACILFMVYKIHALLF
jgi:hypothetical protein